MLDSDDLNNLYPNNDKNGNKKKKGMKDIFIMSKIKKSKKKINKKKK
jgi:hypothetical protein